MGKSYYIEGSYYAIAEKEEAYEGFVGWASAALAGSGIAGLSREEVLYELGFSGDEEGFY